MRSTRNKKKRHHNNVSFSYISVIIFFLCLLFDNLCPFTFIFLFQILKHVTKDCLNVYFLTLSCGLNFMIAPHAKHFPTYELYTLIQCLLDSLFLKLFVLSILYFFFSFSFWERKNLINLKKNVTIYFQIYPTNALNLNLLLKKKKYAALAVTKSSSGELKYKKEMKGIDIVRRDWSVLAKNTGEMVVNEILSGKSNEEIVNCKSLLSAIWI